MQPRVSLFGYPAVALAGRHKNLSRRAARIAAFLAWHREPASAEQLLAQLFSQVPVGKRYIHCEAEVRNGLHELRAACAHVGAPDTLVEAAGRYRLGPLRSDLIDAREAVELGNWEEVGHLSAPSFLEPRSRDEDRIPLRDEPWAQPISRQVEGWRRAAAEVYARVTSRGLDSERSLAGMLAEAEPWQREVVRIVEWGARMPVLVGFDDVQTVWTRLTGADASEFVSAWAWATDPIFPYITAAGGRGVKTVVTLSRPVLELGVTDGEHGADVQDAFAEIFTPLEARQAAEWLALQKVRPSDGLRARAQSTQKTVASERPTLEQLLAAAMRADRLLPAA